eukprot:g1465.t1 g1465   contig10:2149565-2150809(+)
MTSVRYFLPEDGDVEDTPNVFLAPKPSRPGYPPLLGQIKDSFPLPGAFHFRFKTALVPGTDREKHAVAVWMDCTEEEEPVPVWQGAIVAKVTRIRYEEEYDEDFGSNVSTAGYSSSASVRSSSKAASEQQQQPAQSTHSSDSLLGAFDHPPAPAPAAPAAATNSAHSSTGNLLDVDNHPPAPPVSGGSLLDMDNLGGGGGGGSGYHSSGANTPTGHDDLLNMMAPMPTQSRPAQGVMPVQAQYPPQQQQPMQQQQQQQQRQAPMQGQYPMQGQFPQGGQYAQQQQGMAQMPAPPQQQRMSGNKNNAFDKFSGNTLDPLGNLKWG